MSYAERLMRKNDKDRDGKISEYEFKRAMELMARDHNIDYTPAFEKRAMKEFHRADKNGDKHIDFNELKASLGVWETNAHILSFVRLHNAWS